MIQSVLLNSYYMEIIYMIMSADDSILSFTKFH